MKKLLLISIILLGIHPFGTGMCFAQEIYIGNAILYSLAAGYTEGLQLKERNDLSDPIEKQRLNSLWHKTQFFERGLGIALGINIGEYSQLEWKKLLFSVILSAAIFWNVYDGTINMVRGKSFYHTSSTSGSVMEQKYIQFKIPVLVVAVGLNYLFNRD